MSPGWASPGRGHNAVGVEGLWIPFPRVAAARQPWARGRNAVGVGDEWARALRVGFEAPGLAALVPPTNSRPFIPYANGVMSPSPGLPRSGYPGKRYPQNLLRQRRCVPFLGPSDPKGSLKIVTADWTIHVQYLTGKKQPRLCCGRSPDRGIQEDSPQKSAENAKNRIFLLRPLCSLAVDTNKTF